MYFIRYCKDVPVHERFHSSTVGRFDSWVDAEDARVLKSNAQDLEVVQR